MFVRLWSRFKTRTGIFHEGKLSFASIHSNVATIIFYLILIVLFFSLLNQFGDVLSITSTQNPMNGSAFDYNLPEMFDNTQIDSNYTFPITIRLAPRVPNFGNSCEEGDFYLKI